MFNDQTLAKKKSCFLTRIIQATSQFLLKSAQHTCPIRLPIRLWCAWFSTVCSVLHHTSCLGYMFFPSLHFTYLLCPACVLIVPNWQAEWQSCSLHEWVDTRIGNYQISSSLSCCSMITQGIASSITALMGLGDKPLMNHQNPITETIHTRRLTIPHNTKANAAWKPPRGLSFCSVPNP